MFNLHSYSSRYQEEQRMQRLLFCKGIHYLSYMLDAHFEQGKILLDLVFTGFNYPVAKYLLCAWDLLCVCQFDSRHEITATQMQFLAEISR